MKKIFTAIFGTLTEALAITAYLLAIAMMIAGLATGQIHFLVFGTFSSLLGDIIIKNNKQFKNNKL